MNRHICFAFAVALTAIFGPTECQSDTITTTFAHNNGQAGNMFDVNVLASPGVEVEHFDLNLDSGTWDIELYTKTGAYSGSETTPGDWTLHETIAGLTSNGSGNATTWDFTNLVLTTGAHSFYVNVTNGAGLNYTNGNVEGAVAAADANIEILEGTGNQVNFGGQFRPRIWNGAIIYQVVPVPEPGASVALMLLLSINAMRRPRIRR